MLNIEYIYNQTNGGNEMFNNKDKKYAKLLGIDEESYQIFIKRYVYFLRSQKQLNKRSVAAGFFILLEIQNEILKRESEKRLYRTKNIKILKYRDEIVELYQSGCGVVRVSKIIKQNHSCVISKSSIQRFIQTNKINRR